MDFVTHLPRTPRRHDAVWVIVDRLTKLAYFLAVRMTFTLEEFYRLYIREIVLGQGSQVYGIFLEEFPKGYGDTVNDEHCVSSTDKWSIKEGPYRF